MQGNGTSIKSLPGLQKAVILTWWQDKGL